MQPLRRRAVAVAVAEKRAVFERFRRDHLTCSRHETIRPTLPSLVTPAKAGDQGDRSATRPGFPLSREGRNNWSLPRLFAAGAQNIAIGREERRGKRHGAGRLAVYSARLMHRGRQKRRQHDRIPHRRRRRLSDHQLGDARGSAGLGLFRAGFVGRPASGADRHERATDDRWRYTAPLIFRLGIAHKKKAPFGAFFVSRDGSLFLAARRATAGAATEADLFGEFGALLRVFRRDHRIVRAEAPFRPVFVGGQVVSRAQMPL